MILIGTTVILILPNRPKAGGKLRLLHLAELAMGSLLAIEGLAAINTSLTVSNPVDSFTTVLFGFQIFCLGALALSRSSMEDSPMLPRGIPHYAVLLLLLILLPAAFLLA